MVENMRFSCPHTDLVFSLWFSEKLDSTLALYDSGMSPDDMPHTTRTASIKARPSSTRLTAVELEQIFARNGSPGPEAAQERSSNNNSKASGPRVYANPAELKRAKGHLRHGANGSSSSNLGRAISTPDLANKGQMSGDERSTVFAGTVSLGTHYRQTSVDSHGSHGSYKSDDVVSYQDNHTRTIINVPYADSPRTAARGGGESFANRIAGSDYDSNSTHSGDHVYATRLHGSAENLADIDSKGNPVVIPPPPNHPPPSPPRRAKAEVVRISTASAPNSHIYANVSEQIQREQQQRNSAFESSFRPGAAAKLSKHPSMRTQAIHQQRNSNMAAMEAQSSPAAQRQQTIEENENVYDDAISTGNSVHSSSSIPPSPSSGRQSVSFAEDRVYETAARFIKNHPNAEVIVTAADVHVPATEESTSRKQAASEDSLHYMSSIPLHKKDTQPYYEPAPDYDLDSPDKSAARASADVHSLRESWKARETGQRGASPVVQQQQQPDKKSQWNKRLHPSIEEEEAVTRIIPVLRRTELPVQRAEPESPQPLQQVVLKPVAQRQNSEQAKAKKAPVAPPLRTVTAQQGEARVPPVAKTQVQAQEDGARKVVVERASALQVAPAPPPPPPIEMIPKTSPPEVRETTAAAPPPPPPPPVDEAPSRSALADAIKAAALAREKRAQDGAPAKTTANASAAKPKLPIDPKAQNHAALLAAVAKRRNILEKSDTDVMAQTIERKVDRSRKLQTTLFPSKTKAEPARTELKTPPVSKNSMSFPAAVKTETEKKVEIVSPAVTKAKSPSTGPKPAKAAATPPPPPSQPPPTEEEEKKDEKNISIRAAMGMFDQKEPAKKTPLTPKSPSPPKMFFPAAEATKGPQVKASPKKQPAPAPPKSAPATPRPAVAAAAAPSPAQSKEDSAGKQEANFLMMAERARQQWLVKRQNSNASQLEMSAPKAQTKDENDNTGGPSRQPKMNNSKSSQENGNIKKQGDFPFFVPPPVLDGDSDNFVFDEAIPPPMLTPPGDFSTDNQTKLEAQKNQLNSQSAKNWSTKSTVPLSPTKSSVIKDENFIPPPPSFHGKKQKHEDAVSLTSSVSTLSTLSSEPGHTPQDSPTQLSAKYQRSFTLDPKDTFYEAVAPPPPPPEFGDSGDSGNGSENPSEESSPTFIPPPTQFNSQTSNGNGHTKSGKEFRDKPIQTWTTSDVSDWLDSLLLGELKANFAQRNVNGNTLVKLGRNGLLNLGVSQVGHRMSIERAIKKSMMAQETVRLWMSKF